MNRYSGYVGPDLDREDREVRDWLFRRNEENENEFFSDEEQDGEDMLFNERDVASIRRVQGQIERNQAQLRERRLQEQKRLEQQIVQKIGLITPYLNQEGRVELAQRLIQMLNQPRNQGNSPKRKVVKRKSPKRKVVKRKSPKRKVVKRKSPKKKVVKRK